MEFTGKSEERPCEVCGKPVNQSEVTVQELSWWFAGKHPAPCGAPCVGGGLRPAQRDMARVDLLATAHRVLSCPVDGCPGGMIARAVAPPSE